MPSRRAQRLLFCVAAAALALSACGRKGPLELPPDVQAARNLQRAEQQTAEAKVRAQKPRKLSEEGVVSKPEPQPGDPGHRPPADYPFFLDPLL